jgi:hypothetical protein
MRFMPQADSCSPRCRHRLNCSSHFLVHSIAFDLSAILAPLYTFFYFPLNSRFLLDSAATIALHSFHPTDRLMLFAGHAFFEVFLTLA